MDYLVPQIYWEIGHKAADYACLARWWSRFAGARPLYIGQDVERTVRAADPASADGDQMEAKLALQRELRAVQGSCLWYSAAVVRNEGGYATRLQQRYHARPALQPLFLFLDDKAPRAPRKLKARWMPDGYYLFWLAPKARQEADRAHQYAVYAFKQGEKIDLSSAEHLVGITRHTLYKLPYVNGAEKCVYVVTALDRLHNESKSGKAKVKL